MNKRKNNGCLVVTIFIFIVICLVAGKTVKGVATLVTW